MSDDLRTQRRTINEAYFVIDALLDYGLSNIFTTNEHGFRIQRQPRTTGSARYIVRVDKTILATVDIIAIAAYKTVMQVTLSERIPADDIEKLGIGILSIPFQTVIDAIENPNDPLRFLDENSLTHQVIDTIRGMRTNEAPNQPAQPAQPKRGDSIDDWLDWREQEAKRHNKITLQRIATEGGFTLISVKRASAERIRRGDKD